MKPFLFRLPLLLALIIGEFLKRLSDTSYSNSVISGLLISVLSLPIDFLVPVFSPTYIEVLIKLFPPPTLSLYDSNLLSYIES
jgi:hypothetical protein